MAIGLIYLKFSDNTEETSEIIEEKKILSTWDSVKREFYSGEELNYEERYIVHLTFYEKTVSICVNGGNCQEVGYEEDDEKLIIFDGTELEFFGEFNKISSSNSNLMTLEQMSSPTDKTVYYFSKPIG